MYYLVLVSASPLHSICAPWALLFSSYCSFFFLATGLSICLVLHCIGMLRVGSGVGGLSGAQMEWAGLVELHHVTWES